MKTGNFELVKVLHQFPKPEDTIYRKELCIVDWLGRGPKYDIRGWNEDHTKMTKGVSMTEGELRELVEAAEQILY